MPIFQWLFKSSKREQCSDIVEEEEEEEVKSREIVQFEKDCEAETKSRAFTIILRREDSRACFYSTLQLKHRNSLNFERLVRMGPKSSESVAVGCKVLPVCDVASLGLSSGEGLENEVQKRKKAASRMKELIRWAAAAKAAGKGGIKGWKVLYFRNKTPLKDSVDDASSSSSKISFRWDVGSCSTSSVFSPLSMPSASRSDQIWTKNLSNSSVALQSSNSNASTLDSPKTEGCNRGGQWITSDSDFVVLEL